MKRLCPRPYRLGVGEEAVVVDVELLVVTLELPLLFQNEWQTKPRRKTNVSHIIPQHI